MNRLKFDKIHLDYGGGICEMYSLSKICMVEVGRGKDLFSPASIKEMELDSKKLYVVLTLDNDLGNSEIEVRELEKDVSIMFFPEDKE